MAPATDTAPGLGPGLDLRTLTDADTAAVEQGEIELFGPEGWGPSEVAAELANPQRAYSGIFVADRLVAYGGITLFAQAELMTIAVYPQWRGRGLARALLEQLLGAAQAAGAGEVFLEVRAGNTAAQALYRSFGFERIGLRRRYYRQPVEDAIVMRLRLRAALEWV